MKKYFLLLTLIFGVSSCSDFLQEENLSNTTAEGFYLTSEGFESLINANYAQLRAIYGGDAYMFCSGTDLYAEGRSPEPDFATYTNLNPSSGGVEHIYETAYKAIQLANTAIHYSSLTKQTSSITNRVAEVKFLRANAYFLLVQTYGGVPLVLDFINSAIVEFDRSSAEEIYTQIIKDLNEANQVSLGNSYNGRVTNKAVKNLLAKVHLTRGYESFAASDDFQKAAQYADEVIDGAGLTIDFEDLWSPDNDMNEETIFSVQFDAASTSSDAENLGSRQSAFFAPYQGGSEVAGDAPYRTYNLCATDFALNLFTQDDARFTATFMIECFNRYYDYYDVSDHSGLGVFHYYAPPWATAAEIAQYAIDHPEATIHEFPSYTPSDDISSDYQTIPCKKFDDPTAIFSGERPSTRDIVLARLGETYLVAAEAYLKSGSAATAADRINVVRARAGVSAIAASDVDIDFILDERGRELFGEYYRWFDLKRTGKLIERAVLGHYLITNASQFDGAGGAKKILRPIPQNVIDLNQNKSFSQNPAYN